MSATTPHGYPYPVGTDPISQGDNVMRSLGEALDVRAGKSAAGTVTVVIASVATAVNVAVTFPAGRFTNAPICVVTAVTSLPQNAHVAVSTSVPVTASGFTVCGARSTGSQNIVTHWHAEEV
jgi:hypothetical protein